MQSFQNKSESVISGNVLDAADRLRTALGDYITATIGDGATKQRGTTATIAMPFATFATLFGKPISTVTIKLGRSLNSATAATKRLNVVHARSSNSESSS